MLIKTSVQPGSAQPDPFNPKVCRNCYVFTGERIERDEGFEAKSIVPVVWKKKAGSTQIS